MSLRLRGLQEISRVVFRYLYPGTLTQHSRQIINLPSPVEIPFFHSSGKINECIVGQWFHVHRFSTMLETPHVSLPEVDLLTFFDSVQDEPEGPYHRWLNKLEDIKEPFSRDGTFLVLVGAFLEDSLMFGSDNALMLERVKLLQRRYPRLRIFGFQSSNSICSVASQTRVVQTIMKEYITFPILLSNRNFSEVTDGAFYLIFNDFKNPLSHFEKTTELGLIAKAVEEFSFLHNENSVMIQNLEGTEIKQLDFIKEPYISTFQNLLLFFPGCISVDEDGNRLFLSDTNHHRIIIFDDYGKILDCIGSSPGFEDGEFESARLLRPAASCYHASEDCLYFVDSENIAIRRADLGLRTIETIYPASERGEKFSVILSWILDKLGMARKMASKDEELDLESLFLPWHLMRSGESNLFVVNRSFQRLWIMDMASGKIKEVVTGYAKIMEICGKIIKEKVSLLNQILGNQLKHRLNSNHSMEGLSHPSLVSSLATFHGNIIFCDTVGQTLLKLNRESDIISNIKFSNVGVLGLPYWFSCPLEKVLLGKDVRQRACLEHHQRFTVLPGRCDIQVNVDIPKDTVLAATLEEGSIWRQARGSAAEVSGSDDSDASKEKVGVAQQWFDELDSLVFTESDLESSVNETKTPAINFQKETRVHIPCTINISPGTCELVICAVLYLKLKRDSCERGQEENVRRILDILNNGNEKQGSGACIQLMLRSGRDVEDIIFMKPLHLRMRFDCQDHPKTHKSNDQILTESTVEVNVSLE